MFLGFCFLKKEKYCRFCGEKVGSQKYMGNRGQRAFILAEERVHCNLLLSKRK